MLNVVGMQLSSPSLLRPIHQLLSRIRSLHDLPALQHSGRGVTEATSAGTFGVIAMISGSRAPGANAPLLRQLLDRLSSFVSRGYSTAAVKSARGAVGKPRPHINISRPLSHLFT
jgi:hypothetical protein